MDVDISKVPTTAEMDGWDGDSNDSARWRTYYQCMECGDWTLFQSTKEFNGHHPRRAKCEHCGSAQINPQSATSERTFDVDRAKKKEKEIKKLADRRKSQST